MTCTLISAGDSGRNSTRFSTGEGSGNQDESVPFALQIEQQGKDSTNLTMISSYIEVQPWPKGYAFAVPFFPT